MKKISKLKIIQLAFIIFLFLPIFDYKNQVYSIFTILIEGLLKDFDFTFLLIWIWIILTPILILLRNFIKKNIFINILTIISVITSIYFIYIINADLIFWNLLVFVYFWIIYWLIKKFNKDNSILDKILYKD